MEEKWNSQSVIDNDTEPGFSLSIIPVSSAKTPFKPWAKYQTAIAPTSEWLSHFSNQGTVGIIAGKVSQNLECIDIDVKNDPGATIMDEYKMLIPDDLYSRLIVQTTPNKGFHLIYRCIEAVIEKNQKLALHTDKTVIIETRGEGGYFCSSKINNKILQGQFDLLNLNVDIPIITAKERELLLDTARSLTRCFPIANKVTIKGEKPFVYSEPAINEFNDKYSVLDLFLKHRWSVVKEDDDKYYLLREGSQAQNSGCYFKKTKTFFCFSTSTEFVAQKAYNHFQILQTLEGNNDYKTTVRLLPSLGFETENLKDSTKVTSDAIAAYINDVGVRYDSFIQDLTLNGKAIEERDYNTIYIDLKKHFEKEIPRTRYEEIIKSNYIETFNPILDFIETNKNRHPVGTFDKWLDCIELKNKSIDASTVLHFLKKWYVGMIAQALDGEFPNEFFLTLLSTEQGIGKTTFLRKYTLPQELQNYRVEHALSFDDDFKVIMGQALLVIDDEMDGRTYEAEKTFKTVLSIKELTSRRKYDRRISTIKRRCSFAGSGNSLNVVREQQNRRVIPIEIAGIDKILLSQIDLTDLFMEAYHLFANGYKYSFQYEDMPMLKHLYEDYVQKSDVDLIMEEYLQLPDENSKTFAITNLDLVTYLTTRFPQFSKRINVPTIGKIMSEKGFQTIRKGRKKISCYIIDYKSKIMELLNADSQSWRLTAEMFKD